MSDETLTGGNAGFEAQADARVGEIERTIQRLEDAVRTAGVTLPEADTETIEENTNSITGLDGRVGGLETRLAALEGTTATQASINTLTNLINTYTQTVTNQNALIVALRAEIAAVEARLDALPSIGDPPSPGEDPVFPPPPDVSGIAVNAAAILANAGNIGTNAGAIASLGTRLDAAETTLAGKADRAEGQDLRDYLTIQRWNTESGPLTTSLTEGRSQLATARQNAQLAETRQHRHGANLSVVENVSHVPTTVGSSAATRITGITTALVAAPADST